MFKLFSLENDLRLASMSQNVNQIKFLLDSGVDIDAVENGNGFSALDIAILANKHESVKYLLER